ncbi:MULTISPECIES: hypothetical protein [Actinosynnema]|uniref:hypothetical protein n=1 Tax=Actinosynnema TaxID=40566 RepID=UPI000AB2CFB6|nr:hypothetical protein [Actinosynnema pretiosum]
MRGDVGGGGRIEIGGNATGAVFQGDNNTIGDVHANSAPAPERVRDVRGLLAEARAEVESAPEGAPGREAALAALEDLDEELAEAEPDRGAVVKQARRLSRRVTAGLVGAAAVAGLVERVVELFG